MCQLCALYLTINKTTFYHLLSNILLRYHVYHVVTDIFNYRIILLIFLYNFAHQRQFICNFDAAVVEIFCWILGLHLTDGLFQYLKSDCSRWASGWQLMVKPSMPQSLGLIRTTPSTAMSGQSVAVALLLPDK